MCAKKVPVDIGSAWRSKAERVELEKLYARRSVIDGLIESLEDYDRYRAKRPYDRKLKTA
jgi:phosphoribulokinase